MKQAFTLIFSFLIALSINAQIKVTPSTFEKTIKETEKETFNITVTNTETATLNVYWKIVKSADWPTDWQTQLCDANLCYGFNADNGSPNKANVMEGMSTNSAWSLKIDPVGVKGSGKIHLELYSDNEFKNLIGNTEVAATFIANSGLVSATNDASFSNNISLYPNPAQNLFKIKNDANIATVSLINILGKEVWSRRHTANTSYDVSDLYKGMYLVRMFDNNGKLVKTMRLNKTSI